MSLRARSAGLRMGRWLPPIPISSGTGRVDLSRPMTIGSRRFALGAMPCWIRAASSPRISVGICGKTPIGRPWAGSLIPAGCRLRVDCMRIQCYIPAANLLGMVPTPPSSGPGALLWVSHTSLSLGHYRPGDFFWQNGGGRQVNDHYRR